MAQQSTAYTRTSLFCLFCTRFVEFPHGVFPMGPLVAGTLCAVRVAYMGLWVGVCEAVYEYWALVCI